MKATTPTSGGKYQIMAEINMIPLIDVSLVLLIIFMILTPFLVRSKIQINLPKAGSAEPRSQKEKAVEVAVCKVGAVFINDQPVKLEELEDALRRAVPDPQNQAVVIQADKDVQFERFIAVIDAARKVGVARFSVAVKQDPHGKGRGL